MSTARLIILAASILLITQVCAWADCMPDGATIEFPGTDRDRKTGFTLAVFIDHITIFGSETSSCLPLQYATTMDKFVDCGKGVGACFALTGSSVSPVDISIRNSWVAILLSARSTTRPVAIRWAVAGPDISSFSLGKCRGCFVGISFK